MSVVVTGGSLKRTVGESVELTVGVTAGSGVITDVQWDIGGDIVKDYVGPPTSFQKGEVKKVEDAEKKKKVIKFYWFKKGKFDVKVRYKLDGTAKEDSASFEVIRPKMKSFKSKTGTKADSVIISGIRFGFLGPTSVPQDERGITWTAEVERDGASEGQIAYIQLTNFEFKYSPGNTFTSSGDFALDGAAGKSKIFYWELTVPLSGNSAATLKARDRPATVLDDPPNDPLVASLTADFRLFLMYKSDTRDSIWVPLGLLPWHCNCKASRPRTTTPWTKDSGDIAENPTGSEHDQFPEWSKYAADLI